jgi:hypothetical protein
MFFSKLKMEMLYNAMNVYGMAQTDEISIINKNTVFLIIYSQFKHITLRWSAGQKAWVKK